MGSGMAGLVRAILLGGVYVFVMMEAANAELLQEPGAAKWVMLLGPALIYGLLVASWWALLLPGAYFALAAASLGGGAILDPVTILRQLVLTLAGCAALAVCVGVALRKLPLRKWVNRSGSGDNGHGKEDQHDVDF